MSKNSVLEQALLQVKTLEEVVKQNSKEIISSQMKEELNDLLSEALEDEDGDALDTIDNAPENDENDVIGDEPGDVGGDDLPDEDSDDLENEDENEDDDIDELPDEDSEELPDEDDEDILDMTGASDGEVLKVFRAMKPEDGIIVKKDGNKVELSVDGDDYIIKLDDEDETAGDLSEQFEFQDDDFSGFDDDEEEEDFYFDDEYQGNDDEEDEFNFDEDESDDENEDVMYEITLDDEIDTDLAEEVSGKDPFTKGVNTSRNQKSALAGKTNVGKGGSVGDDDPFDKGPKTARNQKSALAGKTNVGKGGPVGDDDPFNKKTNAKRQQEVDEADEMTNECGDVPMEGEQTEAARTKWNAHGNKGGQNRLGIKGKKIFKAGSDSGVKEMNEQITALKKQNTEYKKALLLFKEKLNEVAVFNVNLAYANRLMTEHSTTKQEKLDILKRFDSISTIKESKALYGIINSELANKKPIAETVVEKISSDSKTSSSSGLLSEAKVYENPQFKRMKELMGVTKK